MKKIIVSFIALISLLFVIYSTVFIYKFYNNSFTTNISSHQAQNNILSSNDSENNSSESNEFNYQDGLENTQDFYHKTRGLFLENKTDFLHVAELLEKLPYNDIIIVYENGISKISEIYINNIYVNSNDIFSNEEQELVTYLFEVMLQIAPKNTVLEIKKWSPHDNFSDIEFRFNMQNITSLSMGIIYTYDCISACGYDHYTELEAKWYIFKHWCKHSQDVTM